MFIRFLSRVNLPTISGMSMPTRSRDTVANWEPAAQPVPLPGKACFWVHKGLSVWGQRWTFSMEKWANWAPDEGNKTSSLGKEEPPPHSHLPLGVRAQAATLAPTEAAILGRPVERAKRKLFAKDKEKGTERNSHEPPWNRASHFGIMQCPASSKIYGRFHLRTPPTSHPADNFLSP